MPTFTGTSANETIKPGSVSPTVTASGAAAPSDLADTINGGGGNDFLDGGGGDDIIDGGIGDDHVIGGAGSDIVTLGDGYNSFTWATGDGNDRVDGGAVGSDDLIIDGGDEAEKFDFSAAAGRLKLTRDVGAMTMDAASMEFISIKTHAGADTITVHDLAGLSIVRVTIQLGETDPNSSQEVGDNGVDEVVADGDSGNDQLTISISESSSGSFVSSAGVNGLSHQLLVQGLESTDRFRLNGLGGDDVLGAPVFDPFFPKPPLSLGVTLDGGDGNDVLRGSIVADTLIGGIGNDTVRGNGGNDTATMGAGTDVFTWNPTDGSDKVDGEGGTDTLVFNGITTSEHLDIIAVGARTQLTRDVESVAMDLGTIERIEINALGGGDFISVGDLTGTGVGLVKIDVGGAGSFTAALTLDGAATGSAITLAIAGPIMTVNGLSAVVQLLNMTENNPLAVNALGGNDSINLTGHGSATRTLSLDGGTGDDLIFGTEGIDTIVGGIGKDTVDYSASGDFVAVSLVSGRGFGGTAEDDKLSEIENVTGSAFGDILSGDVEGNVLSGAGGNDQIFGKEGKDVLNGGTGTDRTDGGFGDDTHQVDSAADVVVEGVGEGSADKVLASVSYALTAAMDVEFLATVSAAATTAINLTGNALANTLTGNAGANILDGGVGADQMTGGAGDDVFIVDNAGDKAFESNVAGVDTVKSSITYSLAGQFIEKLILTGADAINGTGNSLANIITGNGAANLLNGGEGADTMAGGAGDDTFLVDNVGDKAIEANVAGIDTVKSSVSYSLGGQFVENLVLTGSGIIDGTGNSLANSLTGNSAANQLNGQEGADTMAGGGGNDIYFVDNAGDKILESNGAGTDTVRSSVSFSLAGQFIEKLALTGSSAVNGTGNSLANLLTGNSAGNVLNGGEGNDELGGGSGNDTLVGGVGLDRYVFDTGLNAASNVDTISGYSVADDRIMLSRAVFTAIGSDGSLAASAFVAGTAAGDADDRILYDGASGKIFYDADGSGGGAAILFAQVAAGAALSNLDFEAFTPAG